jgi:hypothetical protein
MKLSEETIIQVLDSIYDNVLYGLPGSETIFELAEKYHSDCLSRKAAADSLILWQTAKCATSGFLAGIGGVLVLPVTLPADLAANYYIQMRMIAAIAHLNGYDVKSDQVRTFIYCCLLGEDAKSALKQSGLKVGRQLSRKAIQSMTREFIFKINGQVGRRLVTKFGKSSFISLSKIVPIAGGVLGAGVNWYFCLETGRTAIQIFPECHDENLTAA